MPFIKCTQCGKLCSVKYKTCPKCNAKLTTDATSPATPFGMAGAVRTPSAFTTAPQTVTTPGIIAPPPGAFDIPAQSPFGIQPPVAPQSPFGTPDRVQVKEPVHTQSQPAIKLCPACGHNLVPGTKFCGNCGYELGQSVQTRQTQEPPVQKHVSPSIPSKKNPYCR